MAIETTPIPKAELELFSELKNLKVIFDVGARVDVDYLTIRPDAEYHLFEPNPIFFMDLYEKVKDKPNVIANNFGLGDRNDTIGYNLMLQSFVESVQIANPRAPFDMLLTTRTLDWYVQEHNVQHIDFLKIDTEGHDLKVIMGATNWLDMIQFIQYEHWGDGNDKMIRSLLRDKFNITSVGYRNVFCMNKKLVSREERFRLALFIREKGYSKLA